MIIDWQARAEEITKRQNIVVQDVMITRREIKAHAPCAKGWKLLRQRLGKKVLLDTPFPFVKILESNGWNDTLWALKCVRRTPATDTAMRLFAADCAELVQVLVAESEQEKYAGVVDVVRRYAVDEATDDELGAAWSTAKSAAEDAAKSAEGSAVWNMAKSAAWGAARSAARSAAEDAAWRTVWDAVKSAAKSAAGDAAWDAAESAALDACRLMFVARFGGEVNMNDTPKVYAQVMTREIHYRTQVVDITDFVGDEADLLAACDDGSIESLAPVTSDTGGYSRSDVNHTDYQSVTYFADEYCSSASVSSPFEE